MVLHEVDSLLSLLGRGGGGPFLGDIMMLGLNGHQDMMAVTKKVCLWGRTPELRLVPIDRLGKQVSKSQFSRSPSSCVTKHKAFSV